MPAKIENSTDLPITEINSDIAQRLIGRKEHLTITKLATLDQQPAAILARHPANLSFSALQDISFRSLTPLKWPPGGKTHEMRIESRQKVDGNDSAGIQANFQSSRPITGDAFLRLYSI